MWNYRVVEAEGPTDTLTKAESETPSLILLDTSLPYEEDLEILRRIRGSSDAGKVPVIVLSGFPQTAYRQAAFENGAAGLLVKPLDLDLLEDYLDDYISH
jgi:DNA-binding response OmpR family regulator